MGIDIHLYAIQSSSIYPIPFGRNSEWFANLQQMGDNPLYNYLPIKSGIPPNSPAPLKEAYNSKYYFSFNYITVKEFREWFWEKRPDQDAGWLSTYEKWLYEAKSIYPENLNHYLQSSNTSDYHFIVVENPEDPNLTILRFLDEKEIPDSAILVYYFDN